MNPFPRFKVMIDNDKCSDQNCSIHKFNMNSTKKHSQNNNILN